MNTTTRFLPFVPLALTCALSAQGGWDVPVNETLLNSTAADAGPNLSFDGLTLYFSSYRSSNWEIYSSTRAAVGAAWSTPTLEVGLDDPAVEDQPHITIAGLEIYFSSTRAGGAGSSDIMRATRATATGPWNPPTFVTEINSSGADSAPSLTADGLQLFFYSTGWGNPSGNNNSLFVATRPDLNTPFGTPTLVTEFSNTNTHRDCDIGPDGLTITFTEYQSPRIRVMYSERTSLTTPWAPAVAWTEFDTVGTSLGVYAFTRSPAGNEALLAAGFPSANGGQEILSTRYTGITHLGSAGIGQTMTLYYRDPASPNAPFAIGAALGNTGFPVGPLQVPLDPDWLLLGTLGQSIAGYTTGWGGFLDGNGEVVATLTNSLPALTGFVIYVGGLTWSNQAPGVSLVTRSFPVLFQ